MLVAVLLAAGLTPRAADASARVAATATNVRAYARVLRTINPQLPDWESRDFAKRVLVNAGKWRIEPNILVAIVTVESAWHTQARSWAGAIGLGQLMPYTAATLGVDPHDPAQNLSGAARYLSALITKFRHQPNCFTLAFAAYNAGPHAVEMYGGVPPYAQTQRYVVKVMTEWHKLNKTVRVVAPQLQVGDAEIAFWNADVQN